MTSMDGDVVDIASIKPMLDRTTMIHRHVNGDLQWRVIVYDGTLGKQVERLAVGLTEARRLRDVVRANMVAGKPGNPPARAASLAKPGERQAGARVEALTVNQWAPLFLRYYAVTRDGSPRPATSVESATQRLERASCPSSEIGPWSPSPWLTSFQSTWNVLETSVAPALAEAAAAGTRVLVKEPVAHGRLAPGAEDPWPGVRRVRELAAATGVGSDALCIAAAADVILPAAVAE